MVERTTRRVASQRDAEIERKDGHAKKELLRALKDLAITPDMLGDVFLAKLDILDQRLPASLKDEMRAAKFAQMLWEDNEEALSEEQLHRIQAASLISDIGKAGPPDVEKKTEQEIVDLYGIEDELDGNKMITEILADYPDTFLPDAHPDEIFQDLGINTDHTMRDFWNAHVAWGAHILHDVQIDSQIKHLALLHHLLEGNVCTTVNWDTGVSSYEGQNKEIGVEEVLLILLDKYDAFRRRRKVDHDTAIELLREVLADIKRNGKHARPLLQNISGLFDTWIEKINDSLKDVTYHAS